MSGAVKAVGKIFKAVTKSFIGKIIIAAAVTYFTMGIGTALLGGLGIGLSGTLSAVLAGAIDGAIAGGITSALTGGDIGKGIMFGAAGGAVFGGAKELMGIGSASADLNPPTDAADDVASTAANIGGDTATDVASGVQEIGLNQEGAMGLSGGAAIDPAAGQSTIYNPPAVLDAGTQTLTTSGTAAPAPYGSTGGLLSGVGATLEKYPAATVAAGSALTQGLGAGLMGNAQAEAVEDATAQKIQAEQAQKDSIRQSHEGMNLWASTPDTTPRPTPAQRFDPNNYKNGSWIYDPQIGQIRFIKTA